MKQRHKRSWIHKKQLTTWMRFLIKTTNKYVDVQMHNGEPYLRRFGLGVFPILIQLETVTSNMFL